jgi:hypothetical protein
MWRYCFCKAALCLTLVAQRTQRQLVTFPRKHAWFIYNPNKPWNANDPT